MSEKLNIAKATGILGIATSLSRVAGLIRDMVIAIVFGAGYATDAFFMAFTIPNLLRRFFAEGSLSAAFVPTFSEVYHQQGRSAATEVLNICLTLLLIVMSVVTLAGVWGSPLWVKTIGFGFGAIEGKLALTDLLNRIMFPYIFLVSLLALFTGALNVMGHYFMPAVSPLFLNLSMIVSAVFLRHWFDVDITSLAIGVLLGGLLQLVIQFPVMRRYGIALRLDFRFSHPVVKRIAWLMVPGIAGVAIYQINVVVSRLLASFLPEGSVSYLYYGQRLFEFPQGIFIVSLAQAVLPAMSRQVSAGDHDGFRESLRFSLVLISLITIPAAIGLMLCAEPIFSLFFMRGEFSFHDVQQTALALAAYAPGLLFVGISRVVVPAFYAQKNTRTPVWVSLWTLLVNLILGGLMMQVWGHVGLAVALTLSSVFNSAVLLWALRRRMGPLGLRSVVIAWLKIFPATALMAAVVWQLLQFGHWQAVDMTWFNGSILATSILAGVLIFVLNCSLLKVAYADQVWTLFKRKFVRR